MTNRQHAALPSHLFPGVLADDERKNLARAIDFILAQEIVSFAQLQRTLGVRTYPTSITWRVLEQAGFIGPYSGTMSRVVLLRQETWDRFFIPHT